jgi:hypothetical protein
MPQILFSILKIIPRVSAGQFIRLYSCQFYDSSLHVVWEKRRKENIL